MKCSSHPQSSVSQIQKYSKHNHCLLPPPIYSNIGLHKNHALIPSPHPHPDNHAVSHTPVKYLVCAIFQKVIWVEKQEVERLKIRERGKCKERKKEYWPGLFDIEKSADPWWNQLHYLSSICSSLGTRHSTWQRMLPCAKLILRSLQTSYKSCEIDNLFQKSQGLSWELLEQCYPCLY